MKITKLFVTDLDGTFLRSDHSYDRQGLRNILNQFKEKGYLFVAASGRPLLSLKEVFQGFENDMVFLAENGSLLSYQGQMLFQDKLLTAEEYQPIVAAIKNSPYGPTDRILLSGIEQAYISEAVDDAYYKNCARYYPKLQKVANLSEVTDEIVKIAAYFSEETFSEVYKWLNNSFHGISAVTTGFNSVDIILSDINKAVSLARLCDYFDLTNQDVIAFGDNQNDLEMLEFAGTAIATKNARDSIKAVANQVIGFCDDDAVLGYIQHHLSLT
ncbi:Cof-type HAD-IIB family hydrolase [Streptococcus minor]|uniref:Cof-type HAD-IIB family hydrolase n=1 Tax=Streptococcus minor TaxID=229549 RepID=UPI0003777843|nr:Cof-type HAD-IIB family hydrolase [Streptococcus minor]